MRISTFYKWTMLLLAAWFYGGEAKAQFRAVVDEPGGKQALYGDNQPGWNSLRVDVRNMGLGTVSYYECAVGPAGYVPAEADYDRNNCGVQQGTGTARTLSDIPDIHHGINVVWFRAVATVLSISLQPPFFVTREEHSQPENMSWFVDAQADVPTPQNVDANGEVIVTPNTPGGTCDPVIVPMVVENGAWLSYRVDNGPLEGHMTPVPVPASPPYLSDYDLVLTGHSLNEGESLELYVWIAYDGFGHNGVEPATPWIVRCQPPPPVLSISVDSPIEGETYDTLEEATGTASADITEVVLCLDGQTGADCTSCPTLNE
ncbi:MAG: hypothetical protein FWD46_06230, partial [Cystobacterineae bacterium]|nr:hypothetical protein [Cystobacterineae bacterium]